MSTSAYRSLHWVYSFNFCCFPSSCMNLGVCLTLILKEILALPVFHRPGHSQSSQHEERGSTVFYTLWEGAEPSLERCDPSVKEGRLAQGSGIRTNNNGITEAVRHSTLGTKGAVSPCAIKERRHLNWALKSKEMFLMQGEEEWHSREKKHPKQRHGGARESGVFGIGE